MKRAAFLQKMHKLDGGLRVNVRRMPEWFEKTLQVLEALGEQKGGVDHPGHRGTARENPLQQLFDQMLPTTLSVEKGFAVNQFMAESKEQDLLVVDRNISGRLFLDANYFPIESCLASIQVKSNLTRATIRDATVNCATIKRLFGWPLVEREQSAAACDALCYAVFSYGSGRKLDQLAEAVNEELREIPRHFWPNAFYVLGEGLLIPGEANGVTLHSSMMFTGSTFHAVSGVGGPGMDKSVAHPFLWFLCNVVDHCFAQRVERKVPKYKNYWFQTIMMQEVIAMKDAINSKYRKDADT